jgi:hypothetical protein
VSTRTWRWRPLTRLAPSQPRRPPIPVVLTAWTRDATRAGLGIAPEPDAQPLPQGRVDALPGPIQSPGAAIVIDRLLRRPSFGQQTPGAADAQDGEDGVEDGAQTMSPWAAARRAWATSVGQAKAHASLPIPRRSDR